MAWMDSRGYTYPLRPLQHVHGIVVVWSVVGMDKCGRCDAPGPVSVYRASGTDLNAQCCALQLGVKKERV